VVAVNITLVVAVTGPVTVVVTVAAAVGAAAVGCAAAEMASCNGRGKVHRRREVRLKKDELRVAVDCLVDSAEESELKSAEQIAIERRTGPKLRVAADHRYEAFVVDRLLGTREHRRGSANLENYRQATVQKLKRREHRGEF